MDDLTPRKEEERKEGLILESIKRHPEGSSPCRIADEVSLPLTEVKTILNCLCLVPWFVLR